MEAVTLFGAVDKLVASTHNVLPPADELVRREDIAAIRLRLDDSAFDGAFHKGYAANFEDLETMATAVSPGGGDSGR